MVLLCQTSQRDTRVSKYGAAIFMSHVRRLALCPLYRSSVFFCATIITTSIAIITATAAAVSSPFPVATAPSPFPAALILIHLPHNTKAPQPV